MGSEWRPTTLGEVTDLLTGYPFSSSAYSNDSSQPRLLRGDNVGQGTLRWDGAKYWSLGNIDGRISSYWLAVDDIILAMDRPWIEAGLKYAQVRKHDLPALLVQRVARIRGKSGILHTPFLKYVVGSRQFTEYVLGIQTGTAIPHISASQIMEYPFVLPPLHEQERIAHILGTLDDKIELNRQMNKTLEEMARALFKSWFVDFDPVRAKMEGRWTRDNPLPGLPTHLFDLFPDHLVDSPLGEIPAGWQIGTLGDIADLNPESWSLTTRPRFIRYVDLANTKWGRIESITDYSKGDAPSRAQRVLRPGDTIVGTVRPGNGSFALITQDGLTGSSGFAALRPKNRHFTELVYLCATSSESIASLSDLADGGAYPAVRPDVVGEVMVMLASDSLISEFSAIVGEMMNRISVADVESERLIDARDSCLAALF